MSYPHTDNFCSTHSLFCNWYNTDSPQFADQTGEHISLDMINRRNKVLLIELEIVIKIIISHFTSTVLKFDVFFLHTCNRLILAEVVTVPALLKYGD